MSREGRGLRCKKRRRKRLLGREGRLGTVSWDQKVEGGGEGEDLRAAAKD